ncbi:MAG: carboxylesterase family protein [Gemmatimonadaceae bacterium]
MTIFGESSGAATVAALLASPLTRGLFHRAIMESGTAGTDAGALPRAVGEAAAVAYARRLGIDGAGTEAAAALRALSARAIMAPIEAHPLRIEWTVNSPRTSCAPWPIAVGFCPVVDGWVIPRACRRGRGPVTRTARLRQANGRAGRCTTRARMRTSSSAPRSRLSADCARRSTMRSIR